MIAALEGTVYLDETSTDSILVMTGGIYYDLWVPPYVHNHLTADKAHGTERLFYTHYYMEGGMGGGSIIPRLVGFLAKEDKALFQKLITVPSLGAKKVLRSLVIPIQEVAEAIERADTYKLSSLPEIGARTAEKIIVQLKGKLPSFMIASTKQGTASSHAAADEYIEECAALLMQIGYKQQPAETLARKAAAEHPDITNAAALFTETMKMTQ